MFYSFSFVYFYFFCNFPKMSMNYSSNEKNTLYLKLCSAFFFYAQHFLTTSFSSCFLLCFLSQRIEPRQKARISVPSLFISKHLDLSQVAAVIRTFYTLKHLIPYDTFYLSFFCGDNFSCPMWCNLLILFYCSGLLLSNCSENQLIL